MGRRLTYDYYPTPAWCVHRLLDTVGHRLPWDGRWLEPAVGDGAILRAVESWRSPGPAWVTNDIREDVVADAHVDYTLPRAWPEALPGRYHVVLTNPPYSQAQAFVERALAHAEIVIMLLRVNWLAGAERSRWLRQHVPSIYVLPDRPSFSGQGTDQTEYAWMAWGLDRPPVIRILDTTPLEERRHG